MSLEKPLGNENKWLKRQCKFKIEVQFSGRGKDKI